MWDPQRLTTLWASMACYTDSFTFFIIKFVETHLKSDTYCCTPGGIHAPSIQLCKAIHLSNRIPCIEHGGFVHFYFAFEGCPVRLSVTKPFILTEVLRSSHYFHRNKLKKPMAAFSLAFAIRHSESSSYSAFFTGRE
jgi:hypothetical protein